MASDLGDFGTVPSMLDVAEAAYPVPRLRDGLPDAPRTDIRTMLSATPLRVLLGSNEAPRVVAARNWLDRAAAATPGSAAQQACLVAAAMPASVAVLPARRRAPAPAAAAPPPPPPPPHRAPTLVVPTRAELCGLQRSCPALRAFFERHELGVASDAAAAACPPLERYFDRTSVDSTSGMLLHLARDKLGRRGIQLPTVPVAPLSMRPLFLDLAHGAHTSGHLGSDKTAYALTRVVWWPGFKTDVVAYVAGCTCTTRRGKVAPRSHVPLQQYAAAYNNDVVAADVQGPWPLQDGFRHILVVTCLFSRFTLLFPLLGLDAAETARILLDNWILIFGPMNRLLTDRGPNFTSATLQELGVFLGFDKVFTTAYNPAGDPAERRFRHLSNSVAAATHAGVPWPRVLASCAYAYNISFNRVTDGVPFFTWLGRAPRALFAPRRDPGTGSVVTATARASARRLYERLLDEANRVYAQTAGANVAIRRDFNRRVDRAYVAPAVGDLVWLFTPRLFRTESDFAEFHTAKSQNRWGDHPRLVLQVHPLAYGPLGADGSGPSQPVTTHVTIADRHGNEDKVHVNRVLPFHAPFPGNNGAPELYPRAVTAHRDVNGRRQYAVEHFQIPDADTPLVSDPRWTPVDRISARLVAAYHAEHPDSAPLAPLPRSEPGGGV